MPNSNRETKAGSKLFEARNIGRTNCHPYLPSPRKFKAERVKYADTSILRTAPK